MSDRRLVVTLCPLTGTGMVFDGQGEGNGRLELGVSGLLFNNNLVMYDRRFEDTLYPQMTHIGIKGFGTEQELRFDFMVRDLETGTTWNLLGQTMEGELKGNQLYQIPAHNAFWFAWATFWQDTAVYEP